MDDWETEADTLNDPVPSSNRWDDEDVGDEDAPDAWDAEPVAKSVANEPAPEKKKAITKRALQKKEEEERKLAEKLAATQLNDPNHSAAERERLRRLEEERDAALAGDLFGAESIKAREASSDLPGAAKAASSSSSSSSAATIVSPVGFAGGIVNLDSIPLETDGDVDKFVSGVGKRLEKLGKSALASKKIAKLIANITEESIKLGVLRLDDVSELKRIMTVKHNDMTAKAKKGDKKKDAKAAAKPVVQLARNAFMHGDAYDQQTASNDRYDDDDFM